jgi:hypothetical protein
MDRKAVIHGAQQLRKNGSPQMLKLGNASARTTAMRAEASSSCARRAALIPASLPPIMRIDKGIRLWFRFSDLPSFEAGWRFERLAGFFHCIACARVSAGKVFLDEIAGSIRRSRPFCAQVDNCYENRVVLAFCPQLQKKRF